MRVRNTISITLSVIVIAMQLLLPLGRALAAPPAPQTAAQQPQPPPQAAARDALVIPVSDDEETPATAPPRGNVAALTPAPAAHQEISAPFGAGNHNYGQTQRDTDNPQNHPGHHFAGPVNLVNGNLFLTVGDFFIPGRGLSLQLARSYNSQAAAAGMAGSFGYGWTHSYETHVIDETGGLTLTVQAPDGALHHYHSPQACPDGVGTCYEPPPGLYRHLRSEAGVGYTLTHKNGTTQDFDALGRLSQIVDPHGNTLDLLYGLCGSAEQTLCTVVDTSGKRSLEFFYADMPGGPFITQVAESLPSGPGRTITYSYEPTPGELSTVFYPDGVLAIYTYGASHLMTAYNDPRQPAGVRQAEEILYDGQARVTRVTHNFAVDSFFDITYELDIQMAGTQGAVTAVEIADGTGGVSRVEFDANGNPVYEGDWFPVPGIWIGKWWWWHPWRWWLLRGKVDANLHTTTYEYNDWGMTTVITTPLGTVQRFLWEPPYYESDPTDPTYSNVLSATNSLGVTTLYQYTYDPTGMLITEIQAAGMPEESLNIYQNDQWGQLVAQLDSGTGTGPATLYAYDDYGNTTIITDALGYPTRNHFDEVGRPISTTDQAGHTSTYVYDPADRLQAVTDPRGGTTTYQYDAHDNLVALTNANGVTTTYAYDTLDRLITQTNSLGEFTTYEYDALNRLTIRTGADGRETRYQYDAKSRMTHAASYQPGAETPYQINTYTYDPAGNLVAMQNPHVRLTYTYDPLDQRTQVDMWTPTWDMTRTLRLERDPVAGNLEQVTGPGAYQVTYQYDPLNRIQGVRDPANNTTLYQYDAAGRLTNVDYPAGVAGVLNYDDRNHLTQLTHIIGSDTASYLYEYDPRGNLVREVDNGEVYTSTFDSAGQVIATGGDQQDLVTYEYDAAGNRTAISSAAGDTDFVYDDANRLRQAGGASLEYDAMGARTQIQRTGGSFPTGAQSLPASPGGPASGAGAAQFGGTTHYTYDNDMRLVQVQPGLRLLYDPLGNLIGTVDEGGHYRYFLRNGADIYLELDGNGDVLASYVHGGQGVLSMWRDGGHYLFLYDGRGRVRHLLDLATGQIALTYGPNLLDPGTGLSLYNPIRMRGAWWFPELSLILFGEGVFWDPWYGVFLVKAWPWLYWPFGPFHPWRPIFRFWPWPWPWARPWGWPWPRPWPFLWPWPGAWVRPWVIWPFWPWRLRPWWPWWYWRWWWGWNWWGRWWCWHPWWWFAKWWWWPWWHPWWWWGYWWFPWWWWRSCWWWPHNWWWWYWWWWPRSWPGWFHWWCWWWWWPWHWWWWPWWYWPPILGPPEFGDAPDPPYRSYRYRQGAIHGTWWYEWLGAGRDGEWDSEQVDADLYDDGVSVDLVAGTVTFTPTVLYPNWASRYTSATPLHVHGWFDWNGDGDWLDSGEFVVNWTGYPGDGTWPAGQASFPVTRPLLVPQWVYRSGRVVRLWTRFRLDYAANWQSPRGYTRFGEVEDHTFTAVRPYVPPWDGRVILATDILRLTYTAVVSGVQVSISPSAVITPVWSGGPVPLGVQGAAQPHLAYGDTLTIQHEPFAPYETYTVSLSSGLTYTGTEVVLPASFTFTTHPVTLTAVTIAGPHTGTPGPYTFTTSYTPLTATTPITYLWDNGDTTPTSMRTLGLGAHTLAVTATNAAGVPVVDTHTVTVTESCIEITGLDLQLTTPGTPMVDTPLTFAADLTPDTLATPYTYRLTFDGVPNLALTGSADPLTFTHTFTTLGTHTVTVGVWNCALTPASAISDTLTLNIQPAAQFIYLPLVLRDS